MLATSATINIKSWAISGIIQGVVSGDAFDIRFMDSSSANRRIVIYSCQFIIDRIKS